MCLAVPPNTVRSTQYAPGTEEEAAALPAAAGNGLSGVNSAQPFFGLSLAHYELAQLQAPPLFAPPPNDASSSHASLGWGGMSHVPSAPAAATVASSVAKAPPSDYMIQPEAQTASAATKKTATKRRRAQLPGKTATDKTRLFVQHDYHDLRLAPDAPSDATYSRHPTLGGKHPSEGPLGSDSFPLKLHRILDEAEALGETHIISWQPHGRAFRIHDPRAFTAQIMTRYFPKMRKITSLQRQLNLYGFERLTGDGADAGAYYHEAFLRGRPSLSSQRMFRRRVKGTGYKASGNPDAEPDLYAYPPMGEVMGRAQSSFDQILPPPLVPNSACAHPGKVASSTVVTTSPCSSIGEDSNQDVVSKQIQAQAPPRHHPLRNSIASLTSTSEGMDHFLSLPMSTQDTLLRDYFVSSNVGDVTPMSPVATSAAAGRQPPPRQPQSAPQADHPILQEFADLWERASFSLV